MIVALAGGVGAARFLAGLALARPTEKITAIVNTADDFTLHGLYISPDLDTVTYTLASAHNAEAGWGLAGDTFSAMESLDRYGGQSWFRLGDRDLGTHLYRTQRLSEGVSLSQITAEITAAWNLTTTLLPMSDQPVRTMITLEDGEEVSFQRYFVAMGHSVPVRAIRYDKADYAKPAEGVLEAIGEASSVVICPSNPFLSIGPIRAIPGIEAALAARREQCVAISPLIGGKAVKGPADRLMAELGQQPSSASVARIYSPIASVLVVDHSDASWAASVEEAGMRCKPSSTLMSDSLRSAALAEDALAAIGR